jgi:hypothetical protein
MRLWNSATIRHLGESPSLSVDRGNVVSWAAASYEARKFGIRSAMPSATARRKCPDLIFVKPRFDVYKEVSLQVRAIFAEHTAIVEPLSLDEAYLDVTKSLQGIVSATEIAEQIRAKIRAETQLTASAGISYNKFLAKLASDYRKPDGLFVITPAMGPSFVEALQQHRRAGTNGDAQSEVRGLPDHHPKSIALRADFGPLDIGINQRRVTRGPVSDAERSSSHRRVALFGVRRCSRRRSANDSGVVSRPTASPPALLRREPCRRSLRLPTTNRMPTRGVGNGDIERRHVADAWAGQASKHANYHDEVWWVHCSHHGAHV